MAMGDSISAGFAAGAGLGPWEYGARPEKSDEWKKSISQMSSMQTELKDGVGADRANAAPVEFRAKAFSGGKGDASQVTLPYLLSHYNQSLTGSSTGWALPQLPSWSGNFGYSYPDRDAMNVALTNSYSSHLSLQVAQLQRYSSNISDFQDRWKLLTILIGANDLCDGGNEACDGNADHSSAVASRFEANLRSALVALKGSMSRIVIQIVSLFNLSSVFQIRNSHWWCRTLHHVVNNECSCIDKSVDGGKTVSSQQLANLDNTTARLNDVIERLTLEFNLQRPDFAVVNVVAVKGQVIPSAPYLTNLDCFHPSAFAHTVFAKTLWNSLFDKKRIPGPITDATPLYCPSGDDVIHVERSMRRAETLVV